MIRCKLCKKQSKLLVFGFCNSCNDKVKFNTMEHWFNQII